VPHIAAQSIHCDGDTEAAKKVEEFGNLMFQHVGGVVFLDYDFIETCETDSEYLFQEFGEVSENSILRNDTEIVFNSFPTVEFAPQVFASFNREQLKGQPLSRIQQGLSEFSGDRILGLFFIRGNLDAGTYEIDMYPVSYSDAAQEKFLCSKALADSDSTFTKFKSYLSVCLLKTQYPDWHNPNPE